MLKLYTIENDVLRLTLLNKGCAITEITLKDCNQNTVVDYQEQSTYLEDPYTLNALVGPHAGRIKNARYKWDGEVIECDKNDGNNHLHGGFKGLSKAYFDIKQDELSLTASYQQDDVDYLIKYELQGYEVHISMKATPKDVALINLTQHTYFNLSDEKSVANHQLKIKAKKIQALDEEGVPCEALIDVEGTVFDFQDFQPIKKALEGYHKQFDYAKNIDHPFHTDELILKSPDEKIELTITSDAPVMVVYLANYFADGTQLKDRGDAVDHEAIAVEPQYLPNDVNLNQGPSQFFTKDHPFERQITYTYAIKKD